MIEEIIKFIEKNNNLITTKDVVKLGVSKTTLANYVKRGLLKKSGHGIYTLPNALDDDMYLLMQHSSKIIFSHDSALFLNNLSDRTPFQHSITIPSNASLPNSIKDECTCFYIKPDLHNMGVIELKTTFGNLVRAYNAERTICDLLRSRSRIDEEMIISALKNYVNSPNKDLILLADYSNKLGVRKIVRRYMEVLI